MWAAALLLLCTSPVAAFAPIPHGLPFAGRLVTSPPPVIAMQQTQERKALVHRGAIGIGPHVRAASVLLHAVVDLFLRWRSRTAATSDAVERDDPITRRTTIPIFLDGTLCERVVNDDDGDNFCLCVDDIESEHFTCRRAERNGRWVYYCNEHP